MLATQITPWLWPKVSTTCHSFSWPYHFKTACYRHDFPAEEAATTRVHRVHHIGVNTPPLRVICLPVPLSVQNAPVVGGLGTLRNWVFYRATILLYVHLDCVLRPPQFRGMGEEWWWWWWGGGEGGGGWGGGGHKGRTMHSCTYLQYSRIPDAQVTSLTSWKWLGVTLTLETS